MIACIACSNVQSDEPVVIQQGTSQESPKQPQACVSSDGKVHLTFGVGNKVFYCNNNNGKFDSPNLAFEVPNLSLGMRRGPRICAKGNAITITAIGGVQGKGKDGDLLAYRSDDQGKTWAEPARVNDVSGSAREGLHAMTSTDKGILWCVWLDLRSNKTELYASRSDDNGRTWSKNQMVYKSPDGSVCECCHPSIATFGDSIHILFRNSVGGNRDMYLVSSNDLGETFGTAQRLGNQSWQLNGCPMDGGMLAVTPSGEVVTAWRRKGSIFTSSLKPSFETNVGNGEQPWVAADAKGTYLVWTGSREGDLMLTKLGASEPTRLASNARDPVVVATQSGSGLKHVFWEQRVGDNSTIMWQTTR